MTSFILRGTGGLPGLRKLMRDMGEISMFCKEKGIRVEVKIISSSEVMYSINEERESFLFKMKFGHMLSQYND
jgi:hypothetical protein